MDIAFDLKRKLNQLALQAAQLRLDEDTGLVYFDDKKPFDKKTKKAPILENIAYVLALYNLKSQESFLMAEKLLVRLLSFYRDGGFPKYLHEQSYEKSPYTQAYVYPYLWKILENFGSYMSLAMKERLKESLFMIKQSLDSFNPYHHIVPLYQAIKQQPVEINSYSFENALALSIADVSSLRWNFEHKQTRFVEKGHLMLSLFDFIKAQKEGFFEPHLLDDHPLHLKLSLFYDPFEVKQYPETLFFEMQFADGLVFKDAKGIQHVISFDPNGKIDKHNEVLRISALLQLHETLGVYLPQNTKLSRGDKAATYFLKSEPIKASIQDVIFEITSSVNLSVSYEKRPQELFEESSLALKASSSGECQIVIKRL